MNNYNVDVIIPVFNGELYIAETIKSIQAQTYKVSRIIICDDGSTDKTKLIVKKFMEHDKSIELFELPHQGVSAARNKGIKESSANFIAFIDSDDIWLSDKLDLQMNIFMASPNEVGFVHSSYFLIDNNGEIIDNLTVVPPKLKGDIFQELLSENYILSGSTSSVVVRKNVLDEAGYFDENLFHGEDWDLWLKLAKISHVDYISKQLVGIRIHDKSTQNHALSNKKNIELLKQNLVVYSKWNEYIKRDGLFYQNLRKFIIKSSLKSIRYPFKVIKFYYYLLTCSDIFIRRIFKGPLDFLKEFILVVTNYVYSSFTKSRSL